MARRPKRINWPNLLTVGSATVLIGIEVLAAAFAFGWALGGLFGLGETLTYVLEALGVALGIFALVSFVRAANRVEPVAD